MGPLLLGRLLNLNDTQAGVLTLVFRIADDNGLLLLDLKDLRAMLQLRRRQRPAVHHRVRQRLRGQHRRHPARRARRSRSRAATSLFGEPALNLIDLIQTDANGHGVINILAADKLMQSPKMYATFLLWLLSELFERLPEVGDLEKPKLVFFFDEAHLLFEEAPQALEEKIEQVVRLIRSKGVGVYFVTQNPLDVPDKVLGQLGNRVQHALRAFTPRDQKAIEKSAETFRANPKLDVARRSPSSASARRWSRCSTKRALPAIVERAFVLPPRSSIGPITPDERRQIIAAVRCSTATTRRPSTASRPTRLLKVKAEQPRRPRQPPKAQKAQEKAAKVGRAAPVAGARDSPRRWPRAQSAPIGSSIGRQIVRGYTRRASSVGRRR